MKKVSMMLLGAALLAGGTVLPETVNADAFEDVPSKARKAVARVKPKFMSGKPSKARNHRARNRNCPMSKMEMMGWSKVAEAHSAEEAAMAHMHEGKSMDCKGKSMCCAADAICLMGGDESKADMMRHEGEEMIMQGMEMCKEAMEACKMARMDCKKAHAMIKEARMKHKKQKRIK